MYTLTATDPAGPVALTSKAALATIYLRATTAKQPGPSTAAGRVSPGRRSRPHAAGRTSTSPHCRPPASTPAATAPRGSPGRDPAGRFRGVGRPAGRDRWAGCGPVPGGRPGVLRLPAGPRVGCRDSLGRDAPGTAHRADRRRVDQCAGGPVAPAVPATAARRGRLRVLGGRGRGGGHRRGGVPARHTVRRGRRTRRPGWAIGVGALVFGLLHVPCTAGTCSRWTSRSGSCSACCGAGPVPRPRRQWRTSSRTCAAGSCVSRERHPSPTRARCQLPRPSAEDRFARRPLHSSRSANALARPARSPPAGAGAVRAATLLLCRRAC